MKHGFFIITKFLKVKIIETRIFYNYKVFKSEKYLNNDI
jgi:hypothetical protein